MRDQLSFFKAVSWGYTLHWGEQGISVVVFFLLAGLLGPKEFGVVAIATTFIAASQLILDQGLISAIIQRPDLDEEHLNSAFWLNVCLGVVLVLVSVLLAGSWAAMTNSPESRTIIYALSGCIMLEALSVVQIALLRREFKFKELSLRRNLSMSIGGVVGIGMALYGYKAWSLVGQQTIRDIVALLLVWKSSDWRPSIKFSRLKLIELLRFSTPTFVGQMATFAEGQAAAIVLATFFGPVAVGLYRIAEKTVGTVVTLARSSIHTASYPMFSQLQSVPSRLRESVLDSIHMSAATSLTTLTALAAVSGSLLQWIGASWVPAGPAIRLLCIAGMAMSVADFTGPVIQAVGRPRQAAMLEWVKAVAAVLVLLLVGSAVRSASLDAQVFAMAAGRVLIVVLVILPLYSFVLDRVVGVSWKDSLRVVFPAIVASVAILLSMECVGWCFTRYGLSTSSLVVLATQGLAGAFVGTITLMLLDQRVRSLTRMVRDTLLVRRLAR